MGSFVWTGTSVPKSFGRSTNDTDEIDEVATSADETDDKSVAVTVASEVVEVEDLKKCRMSMTPNCCKFE